MPEQPAGERTEEATPKRRRESRRKGMVARSPELSASLTFLAFVLLFPLLGTPLVMALLEQMRVAMRDLTPAPAAPNVIFTVVASHLIPVALAAAPIMLIGLTVGLVVNFVQVGFVVSAEPMEPKLERINPLNGVKRIFSSRAAMEGAKSLLKTVVIGYIAYVTVRGRIDVLQTIGGLEPMNAVRLVAEVIASVLLRVSIFWIALAFVDYFFQRKQMDKQLRMTKDEVKRELRETEQTPELKMALARRRAQLARHRMMEAVKKADAVVTNPTHYAVALRYDAASMSAPQVVAKGRDKLAERIRKEAKKWGVPIVQNPPLAQSLYKLCEVGSTIPYELYQAVAEVIAYVLNRRKARRRAA
jgi:flagellar biosynthetic protein FlhB